MSEQLATDGPVEDVAREIEVLSRQTRFQGFRKVDTVRYREDGLEATREIVVAHHAVAVLAFDPSLERVVMIRQYRLGAALAHGRGFCSEVPAGLIDEGEEPAGCAARELHEETGLTARRIEPLGSFLTTPGLTDELIHLFYAEVDASNLATRAGEASETERTYPFTVALADALAAISSGALTNMIAMTALYRFVAERERLLA